MSQESQEDNVKRPMRLMEIANQPTDVAQAQAEGPVFNPPLMVPLFGVPRQPAPVQLASVTTFDFSAPLTFRSLTPDQEVARDDVIKKHNMILVDKYGVDVQRFLDLDDAFYDRMDTPPDFRQRTDLDRIVTFYHHVISKEDFVLLYECFDMLTDA